MSRRISSAMFIVGMICITIGAENNAALAVSPNFRQLILPLNCQYEIVNDGHGTIRYLTPKECGQVLPPPVNDDPQVHVPANRPAASSITSLSQQPSPVLLPPTLDAESRKKLYDTFWQPVLSPIESSSTKASVTTTPAEARSAAVTLAAVGGGLAVLVVLILFVI